MNARSLSRLSEGDFPANGTPRQKLGFALKYAAFAPKDSHRQPWAFQMSDTHLDLMANEDPASEAVDPDRRELMIGCGAALCYLKLALKNFGCLGRVVLFPDLGESALVARIHFGSCHFQDAQEKMLFEAMTRNRANVLSASETPVPETMLAELSNSVARERGWLDIVQNETSRQQVLKTTLADDAWWINVEHSRTHAAGTQAARWPLPLFAFGGRQIRSWQETVDPDQEPALPSATLAVVKTKTDDKHGWLEAGQTMARTVLQSQALGLAWAFLNPVRRREARAALRLGVGHKGFAQVILRFGALMDGEMFRLAAPTTATAAFQ